MKMKIKKNKLYEIMGLIKYLTECRCLSLVYTGDFVHCLKYCHNIDMETDTLSLGNTKVILYHTLSETHWLEITLYLEVRSYDKFKLTDYIVDIKEKG